MLLLSDVAPHQDFLENSQSWMDFYLWNINGHHLYFASLRGSLSPHVPESVARGNGRASWHRALLRNRAEAPGGRATTSITGGLSPPHVPSKVSTLVFWPQGKPGADWEHGRDPAEWTNEGVGEHEINTKGVSNSMQISPAPGVQESHPVYLKAFLMCSDCWDFTSSSSSSSMEISGSSPVTSVERARTAKIWSTCRLVLTSHRDKKLYIRLK